MKERNIPMIPPELSDRLAVYCRATGHDRVTAVQRIIAIGLIAWETDPHYMPERVCGHVRTALHGKAS